MNRSFRDADTGILKAHGYVEENEPGDISQEEAEEFKLRPRRWKLNDGSWIPCKRSAKPVWSIGREAVYRLGPMGRASGR